MTIKALTRQVAEPVAEVYRAHYGNRMANIGFNTVRLLKDAKVAPGDKLYTHPPVAKPGWMPIETAPKDGTRIIVRGGGTTVIAGWGRVGNGEEEGWCIVNDAYIPHSEAIEWQHKPAGE